MSTLVSLAVFSSLSLNLILQFALVIQGMAARQQESYSIPFFQSGVLFVSVLFLWVVFSYILSPLAFGFFEYVLLFPLSALVCMGLELLCTRFLPWIVPHAKMFTAISAYNGLALTSLMLTINLARTFAEAVVLSLGFALGVLLSLFLLQEIRKRSTLEMVPPFLQGVPLMLISMGLLSLIFTSLGALFYKTLGM
jgi:electron transport complex protein RnfA